MSRTLRSILGSFVSLLLAISASAQQPGIHWQQDIESAKALARQTNRLVLVHVVADGCGPCAALETNVFSQPGVGTAIEQQFVPVKLNANEFPGIATGFGITRVPTDVIITPDGQILSKMISPPTPMAYIAETTNVATTYASQTAQNSLNSLAQTTPATSAPSVPSLQGLNPAYADLKIGEASKVPPMLPFAAANTTQNAYTNLAAPATPPTPQPATVMNSYAAVLGPANNGAQAPVTPIPINPAADPNRSYAPPTAVTATAPNYGYDSAAASSSPTISTPNITAPPDTSVPPSNPAGPVSEEAQRPTTTQQAATAAVPDPTKLPAGAPPLGFDGYCPVSMRKTWKWVPGDHRYGAIHLGRTYWFAGPQEQQDFLANPDFYSPALAGIDPVLAIDHRQAIPGLREHSLDYDGQFYLFSSEATLQQFTSSPERYASGVRQAMAQQAQQQTR